MEKIIVDNMGTKSLAGSLLLLPPDPSMDVSTETIIFLTHHSSLGAKGFVIDQVLPDIYVSHVLQRLDMLPREDVTVASSEDQSMEASLTLSALTLAHSETQVTRASAGTLKKRTARAKKNTTPEMSHVATSWPMPQSETHIAQLKRTPVLWGGPLEPSRGFVLHSLDFYYEHTYIISEAYGMSDHKSILRALAEGRGPQQYAMFLGHIQWREGVLESEFLRHGWIAASCTPDILFTVPPEKRWTHVLQALGSSPQRLSLNKGWAASLHVQ